MPDRHPDIRSHDCGCGHATYVIVHTAPDVGAALTRLEHQMAVTKDEILAQLVEARKDLQRVLDKLKTALEAQDLTAIGEAVAEMDATLEATDPEQPPTPEPV